MWAPNPGAQTEALESEADFLFYGGAAGGGKTDLLIGAALTGHRRSIIFRREAIQVQTIVERAEEIIGDRDGYNSQHKSWKLDDGRLLQFGGVQLEEDKKKWQGRPHDLNAFDELPQFTESQFRFLTAWLRTTNPNQRCRVIGAGNPPTDAEGEWVIRFWGPWLDPDWPNPAEPGELRWFAMIDGQDTEVPTGKPFTHAGRTIRPKSRTFIPARVEDNPYYMATDYASTLDALPEPLRSMLREGRFDVGREDNPWQVIPTSWVKLAQDRWEPDPPTGIDMTAIGADIAQGGTDETVLSPRHDVWFSEQMAVPGVSTPNGPSVAALVFSLLRDGAQVNIDMGGGFGGSAFDHLDQNNVNVLACDGSQKSTARDLSGKLGFFNKRAEWWWRFREALDPDYGEKLALPPDQQLRADLCSARWELSARGIKIEEKKHIKVRLGRSPDRGEAAIYSLADESKAGNNRRARRMGWQHSEVAGYDPLHASRPR